MTITKKLAKVGNSSALLLDKSTMEHLGLTEGAEVHLTITGNSLVVTGATGNTMPDAVFQKVAKKVVRQHLPMLKRLARR